MIPFVERRFYFTFHDLVVDAHTKRIEVGTFNLQLNMPVMTMQTGAIASVAAQLMRGGEMGLDGKLVTGHDIAAA